MIIPNVVYTLIVYFVFFWVISGLLIFLEWVIADKREYDQNTGEVE